MHTAGKVLAFVNILVMIACLFFLAPVIQYRADKLKQIESVQGRQETHRRDILEVDRSLMRSMQELSLVQGQIDQALRDGNMITERFNARLARLADLIAHEETKRKGWQESLGGVEKEVAARGNEIRDLEDSIAQGGGEQQDLSDVNTDLVTRLEETREAFAQTTAQIEQNFKRILELEAKLSPPPTPITQAERPGRDR